MNSILIWREFPNAHSNGFENIAIDGMDYDHPIHALYDGDTFAGVVISHNENEPEDSQYYWGAFIFDDDGDCDGDLDKLKIRAEHLALYYLTKKES